MSKTLSPIHPGEIIREEFLVPMEVSVTTAEFWMGLQANYELRVARHDKLKEIEREIRPRTAVAYGGLLARGLPRVIETEEENERLIAELERLDSLPVKTAEEESLAELLTILIERFETRYELGHAEPLDALKALMETRGLRQRDLIPVFGSSSVASDVLTGKREISKQHARSLAEFFSVPSGLFI